MAVYEHVYRRYAGALTSRRRRFLVVPRYAFAHLFQSRAFIIFYLLCWVVPFVGVLAIYLRHNVGALKLLGLTLDRVREALPIDGRFFYRGLEIQGFLSFLAAVAIAPALISPDLRNNGLALYLSRPFSRSEYVLGKLVVLAAVMSSITWVPGLLLFALQGYLEGAGWFSAQLHVVTGLVVGGGAWIGAVSLLALAVSAWVKWRPVARIVLLILYFVMSAFARVTEMAIGTWWGGMLSISQVCSTIWASLLDVAPPSPLPVGAAWFALVAGSLVSLGLLMRRVRAYEVVR
jgi:ABC-2 type transport system permease protein